LIHTSSKREATQLAAKQHSQHTQQNVQRQIRNYEFTWDVYCSY